MRINDIIPVAQINFVNIFDIAATYTEVEENDRRKVGSKISLTIMASNKNELCPSSGRWTKSRSLVVLSVTHHRQNPLE
jgi:hypothetical protein